MKKTLIMLPIIAGAILLGGCGDKNEAPIGIGENQPIAENNTEPQKNNLADKVTGGLKELLTMGKTMECVSMTEGMESKIYIKGKQYKSVMDSKEINMTAIFDGETFYSWNTKTKAGTKMTMACISDISKDMPKGPQGEEGGSFESTDKLIEKKAMDNSCKEATEAVDFSIPTDVSFVDQCAFLKDMTQKMPKDINLPKDLPAQE